MLRKNTASQNLTFCLINASDGSALTGATVTARRSIDGGAQASATGSVTELGNGQYNFAPSQADTNGDLIGYLFTATSAIPVNIAVRTTAVDLADSVRLGLTALPNAAAAASGGLLTFGTSTGQVNPSSGKVPATLASSDVTGNVAADLQTIKTQTVTCSAGVTIRANVGTANAFVVDSSGQVTVGGYASGQVPLQPTVAGRTLDVSATGEAGIDWANVGSPTTSVNLSGTTISTSQAVASVSGAVGSVTGNVGGNVVGSVGSVTARVTANTDQLAGQTVTAAAGVTFPTTVASPTNITAGTITTVTNLTNLPSIPNGWLTAAGIASGALTAAVWDESITGHTTVGTFGGALNAAGSAGDPWSTSLPGAYSVGSAGYIVGTNLNATVSSRSTYAGGDTSGTTTLLARLTEARAGYIDNLSAGAVALEATAQAILDDTGTAGVVVASLANNSITAAALAADAGTEIGAAVWASATRTLTATPDIDSDDLTATACNKIADHVIRRTMANVEASSSGDTLSLSSLYGSVQQMQESSVSSTTLTVYKTDGSTSLGTKTLTVTPGANPITGIT